MRIPINQVGARFEQTTEIEGVTFGFAFRWNGREGAWFIDFFNGAGLPLLEGVKMVINTELLGRATNRELPTGDFIALDTTGQKLESGFGDLGRRVELHYFTKAELIAFGG